MVWCGAAVQDVDRREFSWKSNEGRKEVKSVDVRLEGATDNKQKLFGNS